MMPAPISPTPAPPPTPAPTGPDAAQAKLTDNASNVPGVDFGQKLNVDSAMKAANLDPKTLQQVNPVAFKDGLNPLDQVRTIREEISRIRSEVEKAAADGDVVKADGGVQLWRMLDLQTRAQDVHFRVELLTKLIDHGASGVKQLSQTQA